MKRFGPFLLFCFVCVTIVRIGSRNGTESTEVQAHTALPSPQLPSPPSNWKYDGINGQFNRCACTTSPDRGGARLCFRRKGSNLNAYLTLPETVEGGQFFCYEGHCTVRIKVDDRPAYAVSGNSESSGNTRIMFLPSESRFLNSLKTAHQVNIDAPFYSDGHEVLHFNVAGLKFY
jgi:hypothetical protein